MEQITLKTGTATKKVETPTSKAKFETPEIGKTVSLIEEAEQVEEQQEVEEMLGFFATFFGFIANRRAKRADSRDEEERLAIEMEKIHGKQKKNKGCGCGM